MPRVTVVIPTYNRARMVCEAVDSVLAQTYEDFEVIVVDDGSTDNTPLRLSEYEDPRVYIIRHQTNQGQGPARNTGILASKGEYIAFLDSDDLWEPTKLKEQMTFFAQNAGLRWSSTHAFAFESESRRKLYSMEKFGSQYEGSIASKLFMEDFLATSTIIVHRHIFDDLGLFTDLPKAQDWEMWLRIAARFPVGSVKKALTGYRVHGGMVTKNQSPLFRYQCHISVLERAVSCSPFVYEPIFERALAKQCYNTGCSLLASGDVKMARALFVRAVRLSPASLRSYILWTVSFAGTGVLTKLTHLYKSLSRVSL